MLVITVDAYALSTECICSLGSDLENEANLSHVYSEGLEAPVRPGSQDKQS